MNMKIQEYGNQLKEYYESIMHYLSSEEFESIKESKLFDDIFKSHDFSKEKEELQSLLIMISKITENYHRSPNFIKKIEKILSLYLPQIKQTFTNSKIFEIFENNKLILLFLFEQKIIDVDETILQFINEKSLNFKNQNEESFEEEEENQNLNERYNYNIYFYPEIKHLLKEDESSFIEKKINEITNGDQELFYKNRKIGENESYLCELIRNDSIIDFISYINRNNISLSSKINSSIFETNSFLALNDQNLIEYATFFGSIQIFQYLRFNNVKLTNNLWIYAIYSNNGEIIHLLEENQIVLDDKGYENCLLEAINCHHNKIAQYIMDNLINREALQDTSENNLKDKICKIILSNRNFHFLTDFLNYQFVFHHLCLFGYSKFVKLYLKYGNVNINASII